MSNLIISIFDKKTNEKLTFNNIKFEKCKDKFNNNIKVFIDNKLVGRNNPYKVEYKCLKCNKVNLLNLNIYVKKVKNGLKGCNYCIDNFDFSAKMEENYRNEYFKKYPTGEEMKLYFNKIVSFQNNKFINMNDFEYIPALKKNNTKYFQPFFKDIKRDVYERIINLNFNCDKCGCVFMVKDLSCIKNKLKIHCKKCSNINKLSLKINSINNCEGNKVKYYNNFQLRFIKFCNKNKILVENNKSEYIVGKNKKLNFEYVNPKNYNKLKREILSK